MIAFGLGVVTVLCIQYLLYSFGVKLTQVPDIQPFAIHKRKAQAVIFGEAKNILATIERYTLIRVECCFYGEFSFMN